VTEILRYPPTDQMNCCPESAKPLVPLVTRRSVYLSRPPASAATSSLAATLRPHSACSYTLKRLPRCIISLTRGSSDNLVPPSCFPYSSLLPSTFTLYLVFFNHLRHPSSTISTPCCAHPPPRPTIAFLRRRTWFTRPPPLTVRPHPERVRETTQHESDKQLDTSPINNSTRVRRTTRHESDKHLQLTTRVR